VFHSVSLAATVALVALNAPAFFSDTHSLATDITIWWGRLTVLCYTTQKLTGFPNLDLRAQVHYVALKVDNSCSRPVNMLQGDSLSDFFLCAAVEAYCRSAKLRGTAIRFPIVMRVLWDVRLHLVSVTPRLSVC